MIEVGARRFFASSPTWLLLLLLLLLVLGQKSKRLDSWCDYYCCCRCCCYTLIWCDGRHVETERLEPLGQLVLVVLDVMLGLICVGFDILLREAGVCVWVGGCIAPSLA